MTVDFSPDLTDWRSFAVCSQTDPELFFPEKGGDPWVAKRICFTCPVKQECLQYAVDNNEIGVWGGTSTAERQRPTHTAKAKPCKGCSKMFVPRKGQKYCGRLCKDKNYRKEGRY